MLVPVEPYCDRQARVLLMPTEAKAVSRERTTILQVAPRTEPETFCNDGIYPVGFPEDSALGSLNAAVPRVDRV